MKNRQNIINIIKAKADQSLMSELNYQMQIEHEEAYDLADALEDIESIAEDNRDFSILRKAREIIIEAGGYVPEPVKRGTGRDTRFVSKGVKYGWPHSGWCIWIEEECRTTKPKYIGESRDCRTNRWRVTCPKCLQDFEPLTTRLSKQYLDCPNRKCNAEMIADYNDEKVILLIDEECEQ